MNKEDESWKGVLNKDLSIYEGRKEGGGGRRGSEKTTKRKGRVRFVGMCLCALEQQKAGCCCGIVGDGMNNPRERKCETVIMVGCMYSMAEELVSREPGGQAERRRKKERTPLPERPGKN